MGGTLKTTYIGSYKNGGDDDNEDDAVYPRPAKEEEEEVSSVPELRSSPKNTTKILIKSSIIISTP